jgi:hypothetical protein
MSGFCLNYMKIVCLTGFLLLGIFAILINLEVEAMKIEKKNKKTGFWISLISSLVKINK